VKCLDPVTLALEYTMRAATLLLVLIATPAIAQEAVSLKWSLKEGDKFFVKDDTEMTMTIGVMGFNQEVKMNAVTLQRFRIISAKQDSTTVEMTFLSMEIKGGGALAALPGLGEIGNRIKNATVTAVLDENMSVKKLEGYDKFLDKLSGNDDKTRDMLKTQFSEAAVGQRFSQIFSFGTNKPVKVGDTWPRSEKMSLGGVESDVKMKYKLDSVENGIAKLGYTGDLTFKSGANPILPGAMKVDKFDMKADKFGGTMKFDTKAGRLTEGTQNADLDGSMTVSPMGNKIDMTMKIKVKQKITVDDKNPQKD
jgi:hypothetical protein